MSEGIAGRGHNQSDDDAFDAITRHLTETRTIEEQRATFDDVTARQEVERDESDMGHTLKDRLPAAARKDSMLTRLSRVVWPTHEEVKLMVTYVLEDADKNLSGRAEDTFSVASRRSSDGLVYPSEGFTMIDAGLIFEQVDELKALKDSTLPNLRDDLTGIHNPISDTIDGTGLYRKQP